MKFRIVMAENDKVGTVYGHTPGDQHSITMNQLVDSLEHAVVTAGYDLVEAEVLDIRLDWMNGGEDA